MSILGKILKQYDEALIKVSRENDKRLINTLEKYEDTFLVLENDKIVLKDYKKKDNGLYDTKDDFIIFKLIPISMSKDHINRAISKGVRDVAPSFDDMESRLNKKKDGSVSKFRADVRLPGILLGNDNQGNKHLYKFKDSSDIKLSDIKSLPRVQALGDDVKNQILLYSIFDYSPNRFERDIRRRIGRALANKQSEDDINYTLTKETLLTIWDVGIKILILSLSSYNESIDHILIPESSGELAKFVSSKINTYYDNTNILIINKEKVEDIYKYYLKNISKYKKDSDEVMKLFYYESKGKYIFKEQEMKDIFKDINDKYLDILNSSGKLSMTHIYHPDYRRLLSRISADYVISLNKYKLIEGNVLIFDDIVTTGTTISEYLVPILNSFHKGQKLAFTFIGNNSQVDSIYGVDRKK